MALSDLDRQLLIIQSVGDVDPTTGDPLPPTTQGGNGIIMQNIGRLWQQYTARAKASPKLRDLYVTRDAHDLVISVLEIRVNITAIDGTYKVDLHQRVETHLAMRASLQEEIDRIERVTLATSAPMIGALTTVTPIPPPLPGDLPSPNTSYGPDANSPIYSGSPYWPGKRSGI